MLFPYKQGNTEICKGEVMYFKTKRLVARRLEKKDFQAFHEMQSNENVMKFIIGKAKSRDENTEEFERIIGNYNKEYLELLVLAISDKNDGQSNLLGTCAIVKNENEEYELGYRFIEKNWGNGYGLEILDGLIKYCLNDLGIKDIIAIVNKDNTPSIKMLDASAMNYVREYQEMDTRNKVRLYKVNSLNDEKRTQ